jgi:predicted RNA-binding protein YlxR (DUF448 family)
MKRKKNSNNHTGAVRSVPQRTCVACRTVRDKRELVRLVRTKEGKIEIDTAGKKEGRGAYICPNRACWEKALQGQQLERTLRTGLTREDRENLMKNGQELLQGGD